LESVFLVAYNHGVAGVMSTLVTDNKLIFCSQQIDDFGFAFVTPLGTYNCGDGHSTLLLTERN
jgi:hypothetical protein